MNADAGRFRRIEALFHAALAQPSSQRERFLVQECDDAAVRVEVAALLHADAASPTGPATIAMNVALLEATLGADDGHDGRRFGAWRVVGRLGAGGMGTVFLAERDDGTYRARAALKMLNPWLCGGALEARFALERQILSDLRHPSIAALLDGGVDDDGVPYLVMEYVEGETITRYAQRRALDVDACLALMRAVCDAVQHAHQNLVVHRDLKPANILVDAGGSPKLLDFGIAKLLLAVEPRDGAAEPTQLLTPEYASPEQQRGEAVTTASDVYSLGVILFELLVGVRPEPARSATDPSRRPSSVAFGIPGTDAVARERRARRLRGDLDTLLAKALAFEPARRYATAQQLGDDIARYLAHRPLRAQPDSLRYRATKFMRRHRLGVAFAAATLLLIAGAVVALSVLALRLGRERDRSAVAQQRAEREALAAQRVSGFLGNLFAGANPNQPDGAAPTLRDVLDRGARDVGAQLGDDPVVQARLLVLMADAYRQLGEFAQGIVVAERAVALRRAQPDVTAAELAESLDTLGELRRQHADYAAAEALHREALALRRALVPADAVMVGRSLNNLALTLNEAGRGEQSLALYEESLALRRATLGDAAPPVLTTLVNIGLLQRGLGRYADAEAAFEKVYAERRRALGDEHLATANVMVHLGRARLSSGRIDEAVALLQRALAVRRKLGGKRTPNVSISLYYLAYAFAWKGDFAQAEDLLREAQAIDRTVYDADNAESAEAILLLGDVLLRRGELAGAEAQVRDGLRIRRLHFAPGHARVAAAQSALGDVLVARGRGDEAEPLYRDALRHQRAALRADHPDIGRSTLGLAQIAFARRDVAEATRLADESAAIFARAPADFDRERERLAALRAVLAATAGATKRPI